MAGIHPPGGDDNPRGGTRAHGSRGKIPSSPQRGHACVLSAHGVSPIWALGRARRDDPAGQLGDGPPSIGAGGPGSSRQRHVDPTGARVEPHQPGAGDWCRSRCVVLLLVPRTLPMPRAGRRGLPPLARSRATASSGSAFAGRGACPECLSQLPESLHRRERRVSAKGRNRYRDSPLRGVLY